MRGDYPDSPDEWLDTLSYWGARFWSASALASMNGTERDAARWRYCVQYGFPTCTLCTEHPLWCVLTPDKGMAFADTAIGAVDAAMQTCANGAA